MCEQLSAVEKQTSRNTVDLEITIKLDEGEDLKEVIDREYNGKTCVHRYNGCGCWHSKKAAIVRISKNGRIVLLRQKFTINY